ncbi:hypothetical protein RYX36_033388 [Vicia faba]
MYNSYCRYRESLRVLSTLLLRIDYECFAPIVFCDNSVLCSFKQCVIKKSGKVVCEHINLPALVGAKQESLPVLFFVCAKQECHVTIFPLIPFTEPVTRKYSHTLRLAVDKIGYCMHYCLTYWRNGRLLSVHDFAVLVLVVYSGEMGDCSLYTILLYWYWWSIVEKLETALYTILLYWYWSIVEKWETALYTILLYWYWSIVEKWETFVNDFVVLVLVYSGEMGGCSVHDFAVLVLVYSGEMGDCSVNDFAVLVLVYSGEMGALYTILLYWYKLSTFAGCPIAPLVLGGSLIGHVSYWGVGPIALLVLGGSLIGHVSYWEQNNEAFKILD